MEDNNEGRIDEFTAKVGGCTIIIIIILIIIFG